MQYIIKTTIRDRIAGDQRELMYRPWWSGLYHGLRRTKELPWMPMTVGVVVAHLGVGHLTEGLLTLHNRILRVYGASPKR